ncbi:unnamed protein product [Rotaria sp. Silwood1]|nr:unnamed protein product [Rotaria sp. Silwood1]
MADVVQTHDTKLEKLRFNSNMNQTSPSSIYNNNNVNQISASLFNNKNNMDQTLATSFYNNNSKRNQKSPSSSSNNNSNQTLSIALNNNNNINQISSLSSSNNNNMNQTLPTPFGINNYINQTFPAPSTSFYMKPVTNPSNKILSIDEMNALANGLHHVYSSGVFDQTGFICNIEHFYAKLMNVRTDYRHYEQKQTDENVIHKLTPAQLNIACQIRSISNMIKDKAQIELKTLREQHKSSINLLKQLAKDQSIIITKPDKGRGVVLMNRTDYIEKMEEI